MTNKQKESLKNIGDMLPKDKKVETTYTSFDFMKIFGIKRGSWNNIKNKYNLDQYAKKIIDGKQVKFVYSQEAYNILKQNYQSKMVKEVKENPKMFALIQEKETLKATLSEYKQILSKFKTIYNEEKNKKESLLEKNAMLETANENLIHENHRLEGEKYDLQQEINKKNNEIQSKKEIIYKQYQEMQKYIATEEEDDIPTTLREKIVDKLSLILNLIAKIFNFLKIKILTLLHKVEKGKDTEQMVKRKFNLHCRKTYIPILILASDNIQLKELDYDINIPPQELEDEEI